MNIMPNKIFTNNINKNIMFDGYSFGMFRKKLNPKL